jgi:hypothetical protein
MLMNHTEIVNPLTLLLWNLFLDKFNGVSYMLDIDWSSSSVLESFTDSAAGSTKGCGSYYQGIWAFLKWPEEWSGTDLLLLLILRFYYLKFQLQPCYQN